MPTKPCGSKKEPGFGAAFVTAGGEHEQAHSDGRILSLATCATEWLEEERRS